MIYIATSSQCLLELVGPVCDAVTEEHKGVAIEEDVEIKSLEAHERLGVWMADESFWIMEVFDVQG